MSLDNEVVNEIIDLFKSRVEEATRETYISAEEKQAFIDRYLQAFREVRISDWEYIFLVPYYKQQAMEHSFFFLSRS